MLTSCVQAPCRIRTTANLGHKQGALHGEAYIGGSEVRRIYQFGGPKSKDQSVPRSILGNPKTLPCGLPMCP